MEQTGETFVVERRGRTVAPISAAPSNNAQQIIELLAGAPFEDSALVDIVAARGLIEDRAPRWDE